MGTKNSKIHASPTGSAEKKHTEEPPRVVTAHETAPITRGPSLSCLSPSNSLKQSASGPPISLISPTKKASPTSVTETEERNDYSDVSGKGNGQFSVGDKILGNFEGNGEWFPGVISKAYEDLVYDIDYDDGDVEESVPASDIKLRPRGMLGPRTSSIPHAVPPEASATTTPTSKTHKSSAIIRVQSSSKIVTDNEEHNKEMTPTRNGFGMSPNTHSSSFKQLTANVEKLGVGKPMLSPMVVKQNNAEVDDYGEYDGSLDYVPRTLSKQNVKVDKYADEDDEFAALDEEDSRKFLTSNVLSGERNDSSALIKNLYREDSKNTLLTPQYYEDKKAAVEGHVAVPPISRGPSIVDIEKQNGEALKKEKQQVDMIDDTTDHEVEAKYEEHDQKQQEGYSENVTGNFVNQDGENISAETKQKHKKKKKKQHERKEKSKTKAKSIPVSAPVAKPQPQKPQKQSDFKEMWADDDDLFGMNGMNIQRVDSEEGGESLLGLEAHGEGEGDAYFLNHEQEQSYDYTSSEGMSHNDSFFTPNEQSHAESFYSSDQQQAGPDWGHISQQSVQLYALADEEHGGEQGQGGREQGQWQGGGVYDNNEAATDSGWSLCYTADGTPYFYSYELQESCWELPTSKKPAARENYQDQGQLQEHTQDESQEMAFQPTQVFTRPHTTTMGGGGRNISRGVVQSKHELAKELNSNKSKSTLHLTNLIHDDDDDAPYDLGLGSLSMIQPLKKVSSTSRLKELPSEGSGGGGAGADLRHAHASKGMKRPQSMATMRRKKKNVEF